VQSDEVHIFQFLVFSVRDTVTDVKPNRRLLLVLLTAGFVVGLAALVWHSQREPSYQGTSLSEWLRTHTPTGALTPEPSQRAAEAVRHIGTNGLPFLVSWIEDYQNPSPWRARLLSYSGKPGSPGRGILFETIAKPEVRVGLALRGFEILGEAAAPAIPELVRVANQGNPPTSPLATTALAFLGKDALPPLLALMTNSTWMVRKEATSSAMQSVVQIQDLNTNRKPGVVLLMRYLSDPRLAPSAAEVLGRLGRESDISVPALAECTRSSNQDLRMAAVISLGTFGASARPAVPQLLKLLDDPSADVRNEATNALQKIAADAGPL
jgi:hypothetical protein